MLVHWSSFGKIDAANSFGFAGPTPQSSAMHHIPMNRMRAHGPAVAVEGESKNSGLRDRIRMVANVGVLLSVVSED